MVKHKLALAISAMTVFIPRTGEGEGGQNGGQGGDGGSTTYTQAQLDEHISGLKSTNEALKNEKTQIQDKLNSVQTQMNELAGVLEQVGGTEGIEQIQKWRSSLENDETNKLLAEGKHEEWFDRRVNGLKQNHQSQLDQLASQLDEAAKQRDEAVNKMQEMVLFNDVSGAAAESKVLGETLNDIKLVAKSVFTFDSETGSMVMKDKDGAIVYGKDASQPKSVAEWLEEQKSTRPYWWPASQSGGHTGSGKGGNAGKDPGEMSMEEYEQFRSGK